MVYKQRISEIGGAQGKQISIWILGLRVGSHGSGPLNPRVLVGPVENNISLAVGSHVHD